MGKSRNEIHTDQAPEAVGPYSQAVQSGTDLYVSGQIGLRPETGELVDGGIQEQTRQVLENLHEVLQEAGATEAHVVKVKIYMTDLSDYPEMNEVYDTFFSKPYPARACVEVSSLPRGALIEMDMVAQDLKKKQ